MTQGHSARKPGFLNKLFSNRSSAAQDHASNSSQKSLSHEGDFDSESGDYVDTQPPSLVHVEQPSSGKSIVEHSLSVIKAASILASTPALSSRCSFAGQCGAVPTVGNSEAGSSST